MANNKHRYRPHNSAKPNRPPVEVKGDPSVLALNIEELGLFPDTLELLKNNNIVTIYDIAKRTEREMFKIQTFNKKHLLNVKAKINSKGIDFLPPLEKKPAEGVSAPMTDTAGKKPLSDVSAVKKPTAPIKNDKANPNVPKVKPFTQDNQKNSEDKNNALNKNNQKQKPQKEKQSKVELPLEDWKKIKKNDKWGFSNGLRTVIEPKFDEVFSFKDGLACVEVNELFGFIDAEGNFVIEPMYECALSFSEGLAVIFEKEKCGYINKNNERVIECKYDAATAFENGRAKVKEEGKWGTIAQDGTILWTK